MGSVQKLVIEITCCFVSCHTKNIFSDNSVKMPSKVCLVTGASYGLGSHIAKQLAQKDWEVVLVARSTDKLEQVKHEIVTAGGAALAAPCDITDKESVEQLKQKLETSYPQGVECVINNAAYVPPLHTFVEGDVEQWEKCVGVNVWGALHVTRALLPQMVEMQRGKIIFISSRAGVSPSAGLAVHSGTKHMLEALAKALRQELKSTGVTVGDDARKTLGTWIPTDPAKCLQPENVAKAVVSMLDMLEVADVQEISIESPATPRKI